MLKRLFTLFALVLFTSPVFAQFEIGASYELRDEDPQSGLGLRVESGILNSVPLINFGLRAHFSYFSDENTVNRDTFSYDRDIQNYDYGVALTAGMGVGLVEPYVGLGLGSETVDLKTSDFQGAGQRPQNDRESNIYWNTFAGAKVTIIPLVKPFVEYRFTGRDLEMPDLEDKTGRIMFGVVLSL
ncbi:outer membrane beta-barrel protein [Balneola vulgaris]|jgi:opacity protein-like surface antigen|uniref:outer membrane beta-barrel protein n=1 Tax=Balneola vulgaris TaxID=287535 RepID=UPI0003669123|nr:outer membrane beta-barrel protein [Balneola vulgaris]